MDPPVYDEEMDTFVKYCDANILNVSRQMKQAKEIIVEPRHPLFCECETSAIGKKTPCAKSNRMKLLFVPASIKLLNSNAKCECNRAICNKYTSTSAIRMFALWILVSS